MWLQYLPGCPEAGTGKRVMELLIERNELRIKVERLRTELAQTRQMVEAAREGGRIGLAREWQPVAEALTRLEMAFNSTRGNYTKELEDLLDLWATVP